MSAPFYARRSSLLADKWVLVMRHPRRRVGHFDTLGDAIDHAHKNWPWWP